MHSQAQCFLFRDEGNEELRLDAGMATAGLMFHRVTSLLSRAPLCPSQLSAYSLAFSPASSLGLAPPKMAECGLAT